MKILSKTFKTIIFSTCVAGLAIIASASVWAQSSKPIDIPVGPIEELPPPKPEISIIKPVKPIDDNYVPATFENLSQLYWALGKFDISDDTAVNNYLMINECPLYAKFYFNDFEWAGIHEAAKKYISEHLSEFPTKFEIIKSISLDRYDVKDKVFYVQEDDAYHGSRRFDISINNEGTPVCDKVGIIPNYPRNIVLTLNRPLTLEKFPVEPELAAMYLEEAKRYYQYLPHSLQIHRYERVAYLRLKVSIYQYMNDVYTTRSNFAHAAVLGRLEGIEIYADSTKLKPLYIKEIKDRRVRRRRKKSTDDQPTHAQQQAVQQDDEDDMEELSITNDKNGKEEE